MQYHTITGVESVIVSIATGTIKLTIIDRVMDLVSTREMQTLIAIQDR